MTRDELKSLLENLIEYALGARDHLVREILAQYDREHASIPMLLFCPQCSYQHIDEGEWATKPHRTHRCLNCKNEWRPANTPTVGVRQLEAYEPTR